jgi:hypothetical protein
MTAAPLGVLETWDCQLGKSVSLVAPDLPMP